MDLFSLLITTPLGFLIELIYKLVQNYGLAIIIFTILIKMILMPLTIKSQKSMKKQQKLQPILAELQQKYANDQQKLQTEMMKLYKDNDVSMTGGCLPLFIQMPILIGLYQVIQRPISFLIREDFNSAEVINRVIDIQRQMVEKFPETIGKLSEYSMKDLANTSQIQLSKWSKMLFGEGDKWALNFDFLGMDLSNTPSTAISQIMSGNFSDTGTLLLLLIPVLAVLTTWLSMKLSQAKAQPQPQNGKKNSSEDPAAQMSKSMNIMMPLMTLFCTISFPSGLGLYWVISNLMQLIQQLALNKYFEGKEDEINVKVPERNNKKRKKSR